MSSLYDLLCSPVPMPFATLVSSRFDDYLSISCPLLKGDTQLEAHERATRVAVMCPHQALPGIRWHSFAFFPDRAR